MTYAPYVCLIKCLPGSCHRADVPVHRYAEPHGINPLALPLSHGSPIKAKRDCYKGMTYGLVVSYLCLLTNMLVLYVW
jgi:hypothetical protein